LANAINAVWTAEGAILRETFAEVSSSRFEVKSRGGHEHFLIYRWTEGLSLNAPPAKTLKVPVWREKRATVERP
jgi:hypothetical protein